MTHYIIESGLFDTVATEFVTSDTPALYQDRQEENKAIKKKAKKNKIKYTCAGCAANVWGKHGLNLACINCNMVFVPESIEDEALEDEL